MERVILHSDANCFYASVEMLYRPELKKVPMAVGGDPEARHGIILTANYIAKKRGVKTGSALWEAKEACPEIVFVPPRYDLYLSFSSMLREIYAEYTDLIEPFGCDESWLDVTASGTVKGSGEKIAEEIRERVKQELGITVSVGVSYNKIFAKLGSDYKKPDAVTTIFRDEYRRKVWPLKASDHLYVGRATDRKLKKLGILTIGGIAGTDEEVLERHFGKMGGVLWQFANGYDMSPVRKENTYAPVKSVGNSVTTPRDIENAEDAKIVIYALSESVASRLKKHGFRARCVELSVRGTDLLGCTRQHKLSYATQTSSEIAEEAMRLYVENVPPGTSLRSLGVRGTDLVTDAYAEQLDLFSDPEARRKHLIADRTVEEIRRRFGYYSVQRGIMLTDGILSHMDAEEDHTIHPRGYFGQ